MTVIPKVLVANRGEIAIRVLRSARELGWKTVALYTSEPHLDANHATYADEAIQLSDVSDYMNVDAIVKVAIQTKCTHVHPGYGFLSESPALAKALAQSDPEIIFIGPSQDALRLAGDKMLSRKLAESLHIQIAPGLEVTSSDEVRAFAARSDVGYPVMIKALDGGGGRGIRVVSNKEEAGEAFKRCKGESPSGQLFVEKALTGRGWKHIEIQIIGDGSGRVNHLWERECSVQRRFQKIVEFAPSRLPRSAIQPLLDASLKIATHLKYKGLGTFEYLVNAGTHSWIFLEINPRVQVEHTITEEVVDIDLVRTQLLLFSPTPNTLISLGLDTPLPLPCSTAIQLRLAAENPSNNFLLSPGVIEPSDIQWPAGRGIRIDTWLCSALPRSGKWTVGTDFDSLLAKFIVRGRSFSEATEKARRALREFQLDNSCNIQTNIHVLAGIVEHPDWYTGTIDTLWLERSLSVILDLGKQHIEGDKPAQIQSPQDLSSSSLSLSSGTTLIQPGTLFHLTLRPTNTSEGSAQEEKKHTLTLTSIAHNAFPEKLSGIFQSTFSSSPFAFSLSQSTSASVGSGSFELADPNNPEHIIAPLTGKIVDLHTAFRVTTDKEGVQKVKKGDTLLVLSVMKMESVVIAPYDGILERAGKGIKVGAILGEGMLVCVVKPNGTSRL